MKKLFFFLAAIAVAFTANAKVTTISPDADNDALRLAVYYAEDGDIIEMTEGTYVQCNNGYVAFDGKSVTVKAAEGANVVLQLQVPITLTNGGKATLQGIKIDASRLTELADWYEHVVYPTDATEGKELVMDGCELYGFNINKSAIYSSSSNTLALCDVKNCYFHDNMKSCFFFEGESIAELSVVNSTFANIATDASGYYAGIIDVRNAAAKVTVDHCTFYNCLLMNTDYAAITMKGPQAANVVISNNIFMLPEAIDGQRAIRNDVEATNCMTFNYLKDNGGIHSSVTKTNCFLNVDPKFVDAANGNYALAEGSPALGVATDGSNLGDPRWNKVVEVEHTYTVAGSSATVFGTAWDPANADNDMKKQEDGTYKLEKTELTLAAGTIEFKVVEDHAWTVAYPGDNYKLTIAEDGIYTITITFNPADQAVAATATKTGDAGKIIPVIAMHGNFLGEWKDTENFTLAADEATATLTLTIAEGNYEFGVRIDGTWTSNGVEFTRENASAEIVAGSGNLKLAADVAGEYTFTWTFETNTLAITFPVVETALDNVDAVVAPTKIFKNGQILVVREGVAYDLVGRIVK